MVLALPCRLKPSSRSRSPTVSAETRCPCPVSSAARLRVDFAVHRSGDIGSPRVPGSTRASSAGLSPHQQTALPLVQVREQHLELRRQRLPKPLRNSHTTTMTARTRSYGLILGEPLR